jgi:hypothetical protein
MSIYVGYTIPLWIQFSLTSSRDKFWFNKSDALSMLFQHQLAYAVLKITF